MIATGRHNELTAAIADNLKRRHTHTTEVVKEAMPAEVVARIEALEQGLAELSSAAAQLSASVANLLHNFGSHVHDAPPEMKSLAERVQALEALASRRAA